MTTETRRGIVVAVTLVGLTAIGALLAGVLGTEIAATLEPALPRNSELDASMAWVARVILVLAVAWLVIGMLSARTRLVGKPGAAAARASWIASTRPWRARESTLGMLPLDRWLMVLVPAALIVATRAIQTLSISWQYLAVVLGSWIVFAVIVRLLLGRRSPWPVLAAIAGAVVVRSIITLIGLSVAGPGAYWHALATNPVLRTTYIAVAFALFVWVFVAAAWALIAQKAARRAREQGLSGV